VYNKNKRETVSKICLQKCKNEKLPQRKAVVFVFCSISIVACGIIKPRAGKKYSSKKGENYNIEKTASISGYFSYQSFGPAG